MAINFTINVNVTSDRGSEGMTPEAIASWLAVQGFSFTACSVHPDADDCPDDDTCRDGQLIVEVDSVQSINRT